MWLTIVNLLGINDFLLPQPEPAVAIEQGRADRQAPPLPEPLPEPEPVPEPLPDPLLADDGIGAIVRRIEAKQLKIVAMELRTLDRATAEELTDAVLAAVWRQVADLKLKELLDRRYERLQSYGRFSDTKATA